MKFFVAKVDPKKVTFENGMAVLSPLRFHYDSEKFALPIRLGLVNAKGTQDLIVNILAPNQRYEVANYPNVTIPTNIDVKPSVKDEFRDVLRGAVRRDAREAPGRGRHRVRVAGDDAAIRARARRSTERLVTLGADVLPTAPGHAGDYRTRHFVLTRLHARYGKDLKDDLVFRRRRRSSAAASSCSRAASSRRARRAGVAEQLPGALRDPPPVDRTDHVRTPLRGRWGGPPRRGRGAAGIPADGMKPALDLARRCAVACARERRRSGVPELGIDVGRRCHEPSGARRPRRSTRECAAAGRRKPEDGCGCSTTDADGDAVAAGWLARSLASRVRRRRR